MSETLDKENSAEFQRKFSEDEEDNKKKKKQ